MRLKQLIATLMATTMVATQSLAVGNQLTISDLQAIQEIKKTGDFNSFKRTYAKHLRMKHSRFLFELQNISDEEINLAIQTLSIGENFNKLLTDDRTSRVSHLVSGIVNDPEKKFLLLDNYIQSIDNQGLTQARNNAMIFIAASAAGMGISTAIWNKLLYVPNTYVRVGVYVISFFMGMVSIFSTIVFLPKSEKYFEGPPAGDSDLQMLYLKKESYLEILAAKAYLTSQPRGN